MSANESTDVFLPPEVTLATRPLQRQVVHGQHHHLTHSRKNRGTIRNSQVFSNYNNASFLSFVSTVFTVFTQSNTKLGWSIHQPRKTLFIPTFVSKGEGFSHTLTFSSLLESLWLLPGRCSCVPAARWVSSSRSSPCCPRSSQSRWIWKSCLLSGSWAVHCGAELKTNRADFTLGPFPHLNFLLFEVNSAINEQYLSPLPEYAAKVNSSHYRPELRSVKRIAHVWQPKAQIHSNNIWFRGLQ